MGNFVFLIAVMHEQAVHNTSLYKKHAVLTIEKNVNIFCYGQVAEWLCNGLQIRRTGVQLPP